MINKKRLVALTRKVISIDSTNPPGKELALAQYITKELLSWGLEAETYSFELGRPNVISVIKGCLPPRQARREALLLTPHIDTVPFGKGWKHDPLGGKIIRNRIYGRGATDDKGNLACSLEVMHSLIEDKVKLKRDLILAATVDEETGSHAGIVPLLRKKILRPGVAVILDSDEFDTIVVQKGLIHLRVQIHGKKAHGAYNWRGISAIEVAARIINKIKKHKWPYNKHRFLRHPTVNVGTIYGGDKVNMVADFCEFSLDIRFLPHTNPEDVLAQVWKIVKNEAKKYTIVIDNVQKPFEIDPGHNAVKTYLSSAKKMNVQPKVRGSEGATVITFFQETGIPAFATGYGAHGTAHTNDEYAEVNTLVKGAQVLERFVKDYCGVLS